MKPRSACLTLLLLTGTAFFGGCSPEPAEPVIADAFQLPDELYNWPDYDNAILHPAGFLGRFDTKPETECEREAFRKLIVAMNMYSFDMMNQSYYIETTSIGAQTILAAFPELENLKEGPVINIKKISDHLRTVETDCS